MSHTVEIDLRVHDLDVFDQALVALGHAKLDREVRDHALYQQGSKETGMSFRLTGWKFPCVVRKDGKLAYDNFRGNWGRQEDLDAVTGKYVKGIAAKFARQHGGRVVNRGGNVEIHTPNGNIRVFPDGNIETFGVKDRSCLSLSKGLEQMLGGKVADRLKPQDIGSMAKVSVGSAV